MIFDWDEAKNSANERKHGINFIAASAVFDDPFHLDIDVSRAEHGEERRMAIGRLASGWIVAVIFTDRGNVRRLISARRASRDERAAYHSSQTLS